MSKWGTFHDEAGNTHVAPVASDGRMLEPHTMKFPGCQCGWKRDEQDSYVCVHHDPERGGFNA